MLGIEDYFWFLPRIRKHMNEKRLKVKPYKGQIQRLIAPIMRLLRGENYSSAQHIANMLNPVKVTTQHNNYYNIHHKVLPRVHVLGKVRSSCMLVLHLCSVMVASQHIVDTRQMLYKYMIL